MAASGSSEVGSCLPGGSDTITALSTAAGRAALAVIRVSGSAAFTIARTVLTPWREVPLRTTYLSTLHHPTTGRVVDHPLITVYEGPRSYTGEDMVEIAVHGGLLVPALVVEALVDAGARIALPGEFTRRAVINGKIDLIQAEAIGDLIDTQSRAMHHAALAQLDGNLSARVGVLRSSLLHLEALLAYDIDFPEEDQGLIEPKRIHDATATVLQTLNGLLATAHTGEAIRHGLLVVISGAPNVGKSSLFNALIGSARAIVTEIPGTTRDALEAVVDFGEVPVRLVDTAGMHETHDRLEQLSMEVSEKYLRVADLILLCGDSVESMEQGWSRTSMLLDIPVIAVRTKADLLGSTADRSVCVPNAISFIEVSAKSGLHLDTLSCDVESALKKTGVDYGQEVPLLTRERHRRGIQNARDEIAAFQSNWSESVVPASVSAVHIRAAVNALEELIGRVDMEDILGEVFRSFCVGK